MKKYLALMICNFLLASPVSAQRTAEQQADRDKIISVDVRAHKLFHEAKERAMELCNTSRVVVPLPSMNRSTKTEETIEATVSMEWSGGCVDGKRNGAGVLSWQSEEPVEGPN